MEIEQCEHLIYFCTKNRQDLKNNGPIEGK